MPELDDLRIAAPATPAGVTHTPPAQSRAASTHDDLSESQRAWLKAVTEVRARRQEERRSRLRVILGANRKGRSPVD